MSSSDPLEEAESQIFFIKTFAKPLLELTVRAAPNLSMYYHHCKANLQSWHQRKTVLYNQYGTGGVNQKSSPPLSTHSSLLPSARQSDYYLSAFPLTLPKHQPKSDNHSRTSTAHLSDHGSQPQSPCESESISSSMLSPISDTSCSYRYSSSSTSSSITTQNHISSGHAAIRAASKSGSLKQTQKNRKGNRNSWSSISTSASSMDLTTFSDPPPPPVPLSILPTPISISSSSSTSSTPPPLDNSSTTSSSYSRSLVTPPPSASGTTPSGTPTTTPAASILMPKPIRLQVAP